MRQIVVAKPTKKFHIDLGKIATQLEQAEQAHRTERQAGYEDRQKNMVLLRLMHMGNGVRAAHIPKRFPFCIDDGEHFEAGKWTTIYHCDHVSAVMAYKNIRKFLRGIGVKSHIEIDKGIRKYGSVYREVRLSIDGIVKNGVNAGGKYDRN